MNVIPNYQLKSFDLKVNNQQLQTNPSFRMKQYATPKIASLTGAAAFALLGTVLAAQNGIMQDSKNVSIKTGEPCKIKPVIMKSIDGKSLVHEYDNLITDKIIPGLMRIDYSNYMNMFFNKELNPKIIKEITSPIESRAIHLRPDDLEVRRTMAAATNIDDNSIISTDGVFQCAVVGIVDREQNLQSLLHCHAFDSEADIQKVLQYILDFSKDSKDIEISIIPGCRLTTDCTVTCINQVIKKIRPDAKINYLDFPNDMGKRNGKIAYVLQNGEIGFCRDTDLLKNKDINPLNEIIYFEQKQVKRN